MMSLVNYSRIFEASLNEIYVFDAESLHFIEVNRGARENIGYSMDELRQLTPIDIKPEYHHESYQALIAPLRSGEKELLVFETIHIRRDGSTYPCEVHLQMSQLHDQAVFVAIILDITERKRMEAYNRGLGQILEQSLNEIYVFDAVTLKFVQVNRGARENIGYSMDELRLMTPLDIKPEYSYESFQELIAPLKTGEKEIVIFETIHLRRDGSTYPCEVHLQLDQFGWQGVFVAIILDTSERKEAEKKLLEMALQSQRAQVVHNFIQDTSHEFRTPLATLSLKCHILNKTLEDDRYQDHLAVMQAQVSRIENLVNSLHEVSRLEVTESVSKTPLKINALLKDLVRQMQALCQPQQIRMRYDFQRDLPLCEANREMLQTAFYQILKNACQFSREGTDITIRSRSAENEICISIEDTGQGIAAEDLPHVFDYLYRGDKARSMQGGYGLGLSISKRIIHLHDGSIDVQSQLDRGTTVTVRLPISTEFMKLFS